VGKWPVYTMVFFRVAHAFLEPFWDSNQQQGSKVSHARKERAMRRMSRHIVYLLVLVLLAWGMQSVAVGQQDPDYSGSVTVTATSVAAGIGWSWGSGTLTLLDGSQHRFKVSGLDVVAVGIKQATAVGSVYHLKNVKDFEGKYVKAAAGIAVGGGAGAGTMQNDKGVVINLTSVAQGVDIRLPVSGVEVQLTD
jgi:hypothetical protein